MKTILNNPPAEGAEKSCLSCRFHNSPTYHDKMWCRDCQQLSHYEQQPTAEGAETIKQALCDDIEKSLNSAKMKHILSDDGEVLPFVDFMSTGDTIAEGREEIENIVEQIYFDMDSWPSLATLHAQRIANKMVEERLRKELIAYDKWLYYKWIEGDVTTTEEHINEYLKTREK